MEKFTKGPWIFSLDDQGDGFEHLSVSSGGVTIIDSCGCCGSPYGDNKHNIPLLAAAPEMYKFLKDIASGNGVDYPIEQLLAKARGE